jgi:hypothetical protein
MLDRNILQELFSFILCLHAEIVNALCELDQLGFEEAAIPASLLEEMANAESGFWIGID